MRKILYFDSETTGLDPVKNSIHQIGGIIEVGGKIVDKFSIRMRPMTDEYSKEAMAKCGVSWEQLQEQQPHQEAYTQFKDRLYKHLPFASGEKYNFICYNSSFDEGFLRSWIKANGGYFGNFFWNPSLCAMMFAGEALHELRGSMPNFKLPSVVEMFEEMLRPGEPRLFNPDKAHDAMYDALMCRFVYQNSLKLIAAKAQP